MINNVSVCVLRPGSATEKQLQHLYVYIVPTSNVLCIAPMSTDSTRKEPITLHQPSYIMLAPNVYHHNIHTTPSQIKVSKEGRVANPHTNDPHDKER